MKAPGDIWGPSSRVLWVGINPSAVSGRTGHHFAGPGNLFWRLLHASGFTPRLLRPDEDALLPVFGQGLTNLSPHVTSNSAELSRAQWREGAADLFARVLALSPKAVGLLGKDVARALLLAPGDGFGPLRLPAAIVHVLPNPSARSGIAFERRLAHFAAFHAAVRGLLSPGGSREA